jgi:hypothetical protein
MRSASNDMSMIGLMFDILEFISEYPPSEAWITGGEKKEAQYPGHEHALDCF